MAQVHIPTHKCAADPTYRYRMDRLVTQLVGRGNGKKTCILNNAMVAGMLERPTEYLPKWFGYELGTTSSYSEKASEGERAVINGHYTTPSLQQCLDTFIEKYVCCQDSECGKPEMDLSVKGGLVKGRCRACGWRGELDNKHKMATYILKHPPPMHSSGRGFGHGFDEDKEIKRSGDKERKEKRASKEKKDTPGDEDGLRKRADVEAKDQDDDPPGDMFAAMVHALEDLTRGPDGPRTVSPDAFYEEARIHQVTIGCDNEVRLRASLEVLFPQGLTGRRLAEQRVVVAKLVQKGKMKGKEVLRAFSSYFTDHPEAYRSVGPIYKVVYEEDWVEEADFMNYFEGDGLGDASFSTLKEAAQMFLDWLREAEEEEEEDNKEDGERTLTEGRVGEEHPGSSASSGIHGG